MDPSELHRQIEAAKSNPYVGPELISKEELIAYSFFLEDRLNAKIGEERKKELDEREDELNYYALSLDSILKTTKTEVLSRLRDLCTPEAYGKIAMIVEKIYSKAKKALGEVYEPETPEDPTKDMTPMEIVAMMETPPIKP